MKRILLILFLLISQTCFAGSLIGSGIVSGGSCSGTGEVGYSGTGTSGDYTKQVACQFVAGSDTCVTKGYMYTSTSVALKVCIWADNTNVPGDLIAQTEEITTDGTAQWWNGSFASSVQLTSGTTYWIGFAASNTTLYYYDSTSPPLRYYNDTYANYPDPDDPYVGTSGLARKVRCYVSDN